MAEEIKKKHKIGLTNQQIKYLVSISVMVLVTGLALYYVLKDNIFTTFSKLEQAKAPYVAIMIGLVLVTYIIEGLVLTIFAKLYRKRYQVYQGVLNGLIGNFFSSITPFASGGQFVQAYTFSRQGIRPADSASILVMLFIVSQTAIVFYGTLALIFGYKTTILNMQNTELFGLTFSPIAFSLFGYGMNIVSLGSLFLLSYCRPLHRFVLNNGINILAKLHLIKDPERKRTSLAAQVATFRIELTRLLKNGWVLLLTFLLEFIKFTCCNLFPIFAGYALGVNMTGKFFETIWSYSYLSMITSFIPIPGASGGAEAGFQILFLSIYQDAAITSAANILTRFISFYLTLGIGLMVFIFYRGSPKTNAYHYDNKKTFVDLQIVSLSKTDNPPMLRQVKIVSPEEKIDPTETMQVSASAIKASNTDLTDQTDQSPKKIKRIWPWKHSDKPHPYAAPSYNLFMSSNEVQKSFDSIKSTLIMNQKNIYGKDDDEYTSISKKYLCDVYKDVSKRADEQEEETPKEDTEVDRAIQEDLNALLIEEKRKLEKREAHQLRYETKKAKKLAKKVAKLKATEENKK